MIPQRRLELQVGTFVVTGLTLLVVFVFIIGDLSTALRPGYVVRVRFETANGIATGSPVQYAGVEVGKVQAVRLVYEAQAGRPQVELLARLPSDVVIRSDDAAAISTFGLLGEKYLEIAPGPGTGTIVEANGLLLGKPPISTERIMEQSNAVLNEFKQTLEGLNSFVGDPEARLYLREAIQEAREAMRHWRALGERLNVAMLSAEAGQGNLGKFLYDERLYNQVAAFVDDLRANPWKLLVRPKRSKSQ